MQWKTSPAVASGLLEPTGPLAARAWTAGQYVLVVLLTILPAAVIVGFGVLVESPGVAGILAAVPIALMALWKPELGLYLWAIAIPFELYAVVGTTTIMKVSGIYFFTTFVIHAAGGRRVEFRTAPFWLAVGFAVWSMLTVVVAEATDLAWAGVLTRFQLVGLFLMATSLCGTKPQATALYWSLFLGAVGAAILGFFVTPAPAQEWAFRRITLTGQDVNEYAKNLMPGVFLMPFLVAQAGRRTRWILVIASVVVLSAVVATGSRSAYAAVLAGTLAGALAYRAARFSRRILLSAGLLAALGAFLVVGSAMGVWPEGLWSRVSNLWLHGFETGNRLWMWTHAIQMGAQHPLMGVGCLNYGWELLRYGGGAKAVHNDFLTQFAETGLPGLLLYSACLVAILRWGLRTWDARLRSCLIGIFTGEVVASLGNPTVNGKSFWMVMAAVVIGGLVFGRPDATGLDGTGASPPMAGR